MPESSPSTPEAIREKMLLVAPDFEEIIMKALDEDVIAWERHNRVRFLRRAIDSAKSRLQATEDMVAQKGIQQNITAMKGQLEFLQEGGALADVPTTASYSGAQQENYERLPDGSKRFYEVDDEGERRYYTHGPDGERIYEWNSSSEE